VAQGQFLLMLTHSVYEANYCVPAYVARLRNWTWETCTVLHLVIIILRNVLKSRVGEFVLYIKEYTLFSVLSFSFAC
jgi:hypothetical protein